MTQIFELTNRQTGANRNFRQIRLNEIRQIGLNIRERRSIRSRAISAAKHMFRQMIFSPRVAQSVSHNVSAFGKLCSAHWKLQFTVRNTEISFPFAIRHGRTQYGLLIFRKFKFCTALLHKLLGIESNYSLAFVQQTACAWYPKARLFANDLPATCLCSYASGRQIHRIYCRQFGSYLPSPLQFHVPTER